MIEPLFSSPTCFGVATVMGADKAAFIVLSLAAAFVALAMLPRSRTTKMKIALVYAHLAFLMLPFFLLSVNATCGAFCMSCHNSMQALALYAVPLSAAAAVAAGFVGFPSYLLHKSGKRQLADRKLSEFASKHSKKIGVKTPHIYVVDNGKPMAFSFRSFRSVIFLSVGMLELLSRKEKEAVMLHELAHIKARSSAVKLSKSLVNFFSPLSLAVNFYDTGQEEKMADRYAASVQKTRRHVNSAKRKMRAFETQA